MYNNHCRIDRKTQVTTRSTDKSIRKSTFIATISTQTLYLFSLLANINTAIYLLGQADRIDVVVQQN